MVPVSFPLASNFDISPVPDAMTRNPPLAVSDRNDAGIPRNAGWVCGIV
jgi:hypothetical protein